MGFLSQGHAVPPLMCAQTGQGDMGGPGSEIVVTAVITVTAVTAMVAPCRWEALGPAWLWADSSGLARPQVPWAMAGSTKHGTRSLGTASGVEANAPSLPAASVALVWLQAGGCWSPLRAHLNPTLSLLLPAGAGCPLTGFTWCLLLGPCWGFCCE